jgi:trehalose-6-phosphate synthase
MSKEEEKLKAIKDYMELIKTHPCNNWRSKLLKELEEQLEKINDKKNNSREF